MTCNAVISTFRCVGVLGSIHEGKSLLEGRLLFQVRKYCKNSFANLEVNGSAVFLMYANDARIGVYVAITDFVRDPLPTQIPTFRF